MLLELVGCEVYRLPHKLNINSTIRCWFVAWGCLAVVSPFKCMHRVASAAAAATVVAAAAAAAAAAV